jgi:hypothetical protein
MRLHLTCTEKWQGQFRKYGSIKTNKLQGKGQRIREMDGFGYREEKKK